jgi:hypothetical protein
MYMFRTDDQPSRLRNWMPVDSQLHNYLLIYPSSTMASYATGYPDVQLDALLYNQLSYTTGQ